MAPDPPYKWWPALDFTENSSKGLKTTQRWQLASGEHCRCFQRCASPTGVVASLGVHCSTSQVSPNLEQTLGSLSLQYSSDQGAPTPAQVAAGLGFHHNFSQAPPNTAQAATKGRSCNSYQVAAAQLKWQSTLACTGTPPKRLQS